MMHTVVSANMPPCLYFSATNYIWCCCGAQAQPYGPNAGDAALIAARKGPLELREVHFSYPLRQNAPGTRHLPHCSAGHDSNSSSYVHDANIRGC